MRALSDSWSLGPNPFSEIGDALNPRSFSAVALGDGGAYLNHYALCPCGACGVKTADALGSGQGGLSWGQNWDAFGGRGPLSSWADQWGGGGFRTGEDGPQQQNPGPGGDTIGNTPGTAGAISIGGQVTGVVNTVGDDDWYAVQLVAGQSYVFTMTGSGGTPLQDTYLELYNSGGVLIAIDDDAGPGTDSMLRFTATQSGTYYINARAWETDSLPPGYTGTGGFTLTANTGAPQSPLDALDFNFVMPTTNISVWFSTPGYTNPSGDATLRAWTQSEINAVMAALATYSAISPLTFTIAASQATATWVFTLADLPGNTLGYFAVGGNYAAFDPNVADFTAGLVPGGNTWITVIHEAGHGLGMAHPHDNGGFAPGSEIMQGVTGPFNSLGTFLLNQGVFTTMTYNDGWRSSPFGATPSNLYGGQATPMALDIAFIQSLYGVNPTTNNGNTTYTLLSTNSSYQAIWDTGGTDTIVFNGTLAATIDLRAATLQNAIGGGGYVSYVSGVHGGWTIANGVVIENATGGSGNDVLIGNDVANVLRGNNGNDTLIGGLGVDTSVYGVASTSASWHRNPDGTWTVTALASGTDTLTSIEVLDFTDRDVWLDNAQQTFSGDGTSDILMRHSNGLTAIWEVLGGARTDTTLPGAIGGQWQLLGSGDFSGDGRDDFLLRRNDGLIVLWNDGVAAQAAGVAASSTAWDIVGVGDFNSDGRDDFLWRNETTGQVSIWSMNGATVTSQGQIGAAGAAWTIAGVGDFNGDGADDILWQRNDGLLAIWQINGASRTADAVIGNIGLAWTVAGVGDFNGDGRADILLHRNDGLLAIWHMNGFSVLSNGVIGNLGANWQVADVGDYNGDGRDDILLHSNNGLIANWMMNGFSVTSTGIIGTVGPDWDIIGGV